MGTHEREQENFVRDFVMIDQGRLRKRAETAVESLLALLDALDAPIEDLEPDCDDDAEHDGAEPEDEHGGDILDEPHDDDEMGDTDGDELGDHTGGDDEGWLPPAKSGEAIWHLEGAR